MDERRALDFISTKLAQLADELQFALVMITHVNDDGQTRGSRNISKEAASVVSLNRDILAIDPEQRNTTNLVVEKNRYGSTTGPAGSVYFDASTFTLSDTQNPDLVGVPVD
jgi:predicted ATP-dependent serine protease